MLDKLHKEGYVHGDIRLANLIFGDDSRDGYLIDYDLSGRHGISTYPAGYYFHLSVRHPDARAGNLMLQSHDRHSLAIIIEEYFKNDASEILHKLHSEEPLSNIAELMES